MITECAVSDCKKAAFTHTRYCLTHGKALAMAVGRVRYDNARRALLSSTPSLHVTDAKEVAEEACGEAHPPRYKLTQRGHLLVEVSGGLPSLGKGQ